jgi:hypothetical protein
LTKHFAKLSNTRSIIEERGATGRSRQRAIAPTRRRPTDNPFTGDAEIFGCGSGTLKPIRASRPGMHHQDCLPYIASGNLIEQFIHKSTSQMAYVGGIEPNSPMPLFAQAIVLGRSRNRFARSAPVYARPFLRLVGLPTFLRLSFVTIFGIDWRNAIT